MQKRSHCEHSMMRLRNRKVSEVRIMYTQAESNAELHFFCSVLKS